MGEVAVNKNITLLELSKKAETDKSIDDEIDQKQINLGKNRDNFVIDSRLGFHFIPNSIKIFLDVKLKEGARRIFNHKRPDEKDNTTIKILSKILKEELNQKNTDTRNIII